MIIIKKYLDIEKIYRINKIDDNYIYKGNSFYVIFKITPILLISSNINYQRIIDTYLEFLKSLNIDFKIYQNKVEVKFNEKYTSYYKDISEILKNSNIKDKEIYISYCLDNIKQMGDIENSMKVLNKIGIKYEKIQGKNEIEEFIYRNINKE